MLSSTLTLDLGPYTPKANPKIREILDLYPSIQTPVPKRHERVEVDATRPLEVQGYLTHKNPPPRRALP